MLIFGSPWHLPPAWGDIPTWITGIATVGLLTGAIITARYAIKAFGKQSDSRGPAQNHAEQTAVLASGIQFQAGDQRFFVRSAC